MGDRTAVARFAIVLTSVTAGVSQPVIDARAGTIHYTVGEAYLDDRPIAMGGQVFLPMKEGQVLRTGMGRAEILLAPGVFLRLDPAGAVRLIDARLEGMLLELQRGAALVEVVEMSKYRRVEVQFGGT